MRALKAALERGPGGGGSQFIGVKFNRSRGNSFDLSAQSCIESGNSIFSSHIPVVSSQVQVSFLNNPNLFYRKPEPWISLPMILFCLWRSIGLAIFFSFSE